MTPRENRNRRFFQASLLGLVALVAFSAVAFWSWRYFSKLSRPQTTSDFIRSLHSERLDDRKYAVRTLSAAGAVEADVVIPALLGSLGDRSPEVRADAARSLGAYVGFTLSTPSPGRASFAP